MATTLAELEQRVQALEAAVASLREELANGSPSPKASVAGVLQRSQAPDHTAAIEAYWADIERRAGLVPGEEFGIEQLRARFAAEGILPGDEGIRQELEAMYNPEEEDEE